MEWMHAVVLVTAGLGTGLLVGLVGVGGGIIFAPILLYYFQSIGAGPDVVATATVATSLFCVVLAATSSAWHQYRRDSADIRTALWTGGTGALGVWLAATFITTQPWFNIRAFQIVFSSILILSILRMLKPSQVVRANPGAEGSADVPIAAMAGVGLVSGGLSAVAGVGGGTVLVPAYHNLFRFPIILATGTSSATIVLTSIFGVVTYVASGWGVVLPSPLSLGYVDVASGLMLAVPALLTSRAGVVMAHRVKRRTLALAFSAVASIVVIKLLYDAILA